MKTYTNTSHYVEIDGVDVPLSHRVSEHIDPIYTFSDDGKRLLLVYAVPDEDCPHPLDDCDGMGRILRRGDYGHDEDEMTRIAGYDRYGNPDYSIIPQGRVAAEVRRQLAAGFCDWAGLVNELEMDDEVTFIDGGDEVDPRDHQKIIDEAARVAEADPEYAEHIWTYFNCPPGTPTLGDLWEEAQAQKLADEFAVILDVYDHSGQLWSINGGGMQCRWDTSVAAGMWVPDKHLIPECERRAAVYAKGEILPTRGLLRGPDRYGAVPKGGEGHLFDDWSEAFKFLESQQIEVTEADIQLGKVRAAEGLAKQALDGFNAWLAGDCWGVVTEEYAVEDGQATQVEYDSCWGYVGHEFAEDVMRSEFEGRVPAYQVKAS